LCDRCLGGGEPGGQSLSESSTRKELRALEERIKQLEALLRPAHGGKRSVWPQKRRAAWFAAAVLGLLVSGILLRVVALVAGGVLLLGLGLCVWLFRIVPSLDPPETGTTSALERELEGLRREYSRLADDLRRCSADR
jgi:hypothetical protein